MTPNTKPLVEHRRVLGIDGWTDYQLLRRLNCYDVWSATPSRSGEPCWTFSDDRS